MNTFNKISPDFLKELSSKLALDVLFSDRESLFDYAHDYTEDLVFLPEIIAKPYTVEEVQWIVICCHKFMIPLTPRGAGTGLSGGALPVYGGLLLSLERMNKIIKVDEENLQATVEPGVINEVLQQEVKRKNLFYPPDPASKGSCSLGGNIAENAGGPKAVKYGVTSHYVLNLELVLPNGEIIWTGANTLKNATGLNLTQLVVGSEGTLGIVTKIVLKLIPLPQKNILLWVPFNNAIDACEAVSAILKAGITPSCIEFMERDALTCAYTFLRKNIDFDDEMNAVLLIEVDGNYEEQLLKDCEAISEITYQHLSKDVLLADAYDQKEQWWKIRRCIGEAVKQLSIYKEEDTVVPRAFLPQLLQGVKEIGLHHGFRSVCFGHAGDGNLHVNILRDTLTDEQWKLVENQGIREIFELCKSLGGTISGEHGIGYVQKKYLDIIFSETELNLMRSIKKVFDPTGIMNPGKAF
ncbi:MAG: FAD-binding protein [Bacteroidetes bacterium]|nr:FAD-binding protein [Bacteroidota bacterium]